MKKYSLFVLLAALVAVNGCKKDKDQGIVGCDLMHIIRTTVGDTLNFTYNAQHKVASFYQPYATWLYNYNGLSGETYYRVNDTLTVPDKELYFDGQGRVTTIVVDRVGSYYGTYTFNYNNKGQLIYCNQTIHEFGSYRYYTDSLFYEDDNLVTILRHYKSVTDDLRTDSIHISYTTMENKGGHYIWAMNPPMSTNGNEPNWMEIYHLLGTTSKNLPLQWLNYDDTDTLKFQLDYTFLLNANGYPEDETVNRTLYYPSIQNYKYQYSCY